MKEVIFYPSLKNNTGIKQLKSNDRAGVLDRRTSETQSMRYPRIFRELQVICHVWGIVLHPRILEDKMSSRAGSREALQVILKGF